MEEKDLLQAALAKAITDAVPPEVQKGVFQKALQNHLFYSDDGRHGNGAVLTDIFKRALDDATRSIAHAIVSQPENEARIREAIQAGLEDALKDGALRKRIGERIIRGIQGW
jgi:4-hydroxy-L-threonine phosphate dehydrogenase PdxA